MSDLLVSILIVNWNTRELVLECLRSLPKPGTGPSYEVVVVDNGSVDGSGDALSRETGITLYETNATSATQPRSTRLTGAREEISFSFSIPTSSSRPPHSVP